MRDIKIHKQVGRLTVLLGVVAVFLLFSAASAPASSVAYVANYVDGTVTPISGATNKAGSPFKVGAGPTAIAISSNGKTAYVAAGKANRINVLNLRTRTVTHSIAVGAHPLALALTPNGQDAYVAEPGTSTDNPANPGYGNVQEIDLAHNRVTRAITVGAHPTAIAITPNGKTVYVTCGYGSFEIVGISTATNKITSTLSTEVAPGDQHPWVANGIAITPNGKTAFVSMMPDFASDTGTVWPVDLATNKVVTGQNFLWPFGYPIGPAIAPNGKTVYVVADQGESNIFDAFNVATSASIVDRVIFSGDPLPMMGANAMTVSPNGKTVYVACSKDPSRGVAVPLNAATGKAGSWITVGVDPDAIAIH
jgi:YVTN family beta-propeller protein